MMEKKSGKSKKGILFLILGTLAVIAGVMIFAVVTGRVTAALVESRYGGTASYVLLTASIPCIAICFVLLEAILFLQYLPDTAAKLQSRRPMLGQPEQPMYSKKVINLVCLGLLALTVLCGFVSTNTYTVVSEDGISTHFFAETSRYEWRQVTRYTVDCDTDRGLSVTYTMRDGKQFEVLQNAVSTTDTFDEQYGSATAFALHTSEKLHELQIPKTCYHQELAISFYRDTMPETWTYVAQLINYQSTTLQPDEMAPVVTETVTEETTIAD